MPRASLRRSLLAAHLGALCAAVLALAAPAPAAQTAFVPGDLYLYNPALMGGSSSAGGIARIDPATGAASLLHDLQSSQSQTGAMCWDPHRKQLIFSGDFVSNSVRLWASDAAGNLQELGFEGVVFRGMTSRGDGIVYLSRTSGGGSFFVYLDAANRLQTLLDATGAAPYALPGIQNNPIKDMLYHAPTNSLIVAAGVAGNTGCGGGASSGVSLRRLPLSADGTRVVGAPDCVEFEVSTSGEDVEGLSHGPGDSVIVVVDTNSNAQESRMWQYDPATNSAVPYAANGSYLGAAAVSAGSWSSRISAAVIFDSFANLLRAFSFGQVGDGVEITPTIQISSAGGSGETATLREITDSGCDGAWRAFGDALAGSGGFAPTFTGGGCAEPAGTVQLTLDDVLGGTSGFAFAGLTEAALSFKGGTLYVFPFTLQVPLNNVGGAAGVPGAGGLSLPVTLPPDPGLSGLSVFLQAAFVDAAAPVGVSLTNGLEMLLG